MSDTWDNLLRKLAYQDIIPDAVHRVLLWGPPRTGKSSIANTIWPGEVERVTLHRQQPVEDLLGGYVLQDGSTVWADGPAVRAMRNGRVLVLDEVDQFSPETRCVLHAILDDPPAITLADGSRVDGSAKFCIIGTTNAQPTAMPPALYDRWDVILKADTLSEGLKKALGQLATPASNVVQADGCYRWERVASVNLFLAASKMRAKGMKDDQIVHALGLTGQQARDFLTVIAK